MREITGKISKYIENNKWILLVSLVFIIWKFFLVSIILGGEMMKTSDALIYISHIDSINKCSHIIFCNDFLTSLTRYTGFEHLSYRLFFGSIGHLLKMSSLNVFHLSFYIGILILVPSLIFFLKNIETDKKLIAFLLFFFALYNGGGYHGFWWVVPSFFATLLIFIIFAIILGNYRHWKMILLILIPIGLYTHTIFLYLMVPIVFFYIIYSFFLKKIDIVMLKKVVFSIFILIVFYVPISYYLENNPYGPETFFNKKNINLNAQSIEKNNLLQVKQGHFLFEKLFPGFRDIKGIYFDWIFFNPVFVIIFVYIIFILFYYKQYKILSVYLASLIFALLSSINVNAERSLIFTWPITYLLYAYGIWFSFKLNNELFKNRFANTTVKTFLFLGIVIFATVNIIYSYGMNKELIFSVQKFLNV